MVAVIVPWKTCPAEIVACINGGRKESELWMSFRSRKVSFA